MVDEANQAAAVTIGILFPGELGSSLGRRLLDGGFRVVTTTVGRSHRTRRLCSDAGLEVLPSSADVVAAADVVVSTVTQPAAAGVASQFCKDAAAYESKPLFVDLNSVSPQTISNIAVELQHAGSKFVDATVHGPASRIAEDAVMYVSGEDAEWVEALFGRVVNTRVVGNTPGAASAFKLLLGGLNKGLVALFLEMSLIARETNMLQSFLDRCDEYYPEIIALIERLLPTYSQHASRRADEMHELESYAKSLDARSAFACGSRQLFESMSQLDFHHVSGDPKKSRNDMIAMIEHVGRERILNDMNQATPVTDGACHDTTEVR